MYQEYDEKMRQAEHDAEIMAFNDWQQQYFKDPDDEPHGYDWIKREQLENGNDDGDCPA